MKRHANYVSLQVRQKTFIYDAIKVAIEAKKSEEKKKRAFIFRAMCGNAANKNKRQTKTVYFSPYTYKAKTNGKIIGTNVR